MEGDFYKTIVRNESFSLQLVFDDFNRRLRVEDYRGNVKNIIHYCEKAAKEKAYEKLIVKARLEHFPLLTEKGFECEGWIRGYFNGSDAYFLTKYFAPTRRISNEWCREDELLQAVQTKEYNRRSVFPEGYQMRKAETNDASELANLYQTVFAVYPTPLQEEEYVRHVMETGTVFYLIEKDGKIVSAASAEVNEMYHNAELTDCATLPDHRQYGLMKHLIAALEEYLRNQQIYCAYSLARAQSFGMNAVFWQLDYRYSGRLKNNCYIYSDLEDMNVWVKDLSVQT